jgi:hypothetical protein
MRLLGVLLVVRTCSACHIAGTEKRECSDKWGGETPGCAYGHWQYDGLRQLTTCRESDVTTDSAWPCLGRRCLSLSYEGITSIEKDAFCFDDLSTVQVLDLSFNSLQWISEGNFKGLTGVTHVYLSGNPIISCDPNAILKDLASVTHLFIHGGTPTASLQEAVDILQSDKKEREQEEAEYQAKH